MRFTILLVLSLTSLSIAQNPDWSRFYPLMVGRNGGFYDLYRTTDGGFAMAGTDFNARVGMQNAGFWFVKTDSEREVEINRTYGSDRWNEAICYSLIQCDDDGYLLGGHVRDSTWSDILKIIKIDRDGEPVWWLTGPDESECNAVIELKAGGYLACGRISRQNAYVLRLNGRGEIIWERRYAINIAERFMTVREVEGGYVFGGTGRNGNEGYSAKLVKTNENGEITWIQEYDEFPLIASLISCRNGGFAAAGGFFDPGANGGSGWLLRVDQEGEELWSRGFAVRSFAWGITELPDGFVFVGNRIDAEVTRTSADGDSIWSRRFHGNERIAGLLFSVISDRDGSIYCVGWNSINGLRGGALVKITPERVAPLIVDREPEQSELIALRNDSINFSITAVDNQGDSLFYLWSVDNQEYYPDLTDTFAACISFPQLGIDTVKCVVRDDDGADSAIWHVTVTDLYVSAFTPDTLALAIRRGQSVDFSLDTVRAVPGDPIEYLWLKRNMDAMEEVDTTGRDAGVTIPFLQSGHYRVDGIAFRGESLDIVSWDVSVRGAIWAFAPEDLAFEVLPDSVVSFIVEPTFPDAEGQTIQWLIDGELAAEDTTLFNWSFGEADSCPPHLVQVVVADTVESDTVTWAVTVVEPDFVSDKRDAYPTRAELLTVSPNPFNSTLTISFPKGIPPSIEGGRGGLSLCIFDISGRVVADLSNSAFRNPHSAFGTVIWDATSVPAGVYFVRLQTGAIVATKKVVLMR